VIAAPAPNNASDMGSARLAWLTGPDIRDDVNPGGAHQLKDQPTDGSKTPSWRTPDTEPPRSAWGLAPSPAPSQENSASEGSHSINRDQTARLERLAAAARLANQIPLPAITYLPCLPGGQKSSESRSNPGQIGDPD